MAPKKPTPDTIQTQSVVKGSSGARVNKVKYDAMRNALLKAVPTSKDGIPFKELPNAVAAHLPADWEGSVSWYVTTVKLDLEANGELERVAGAKPQRVRRIRKR